MTKFAFALVASVIVMVTVLQVENRSDRADHSRKFSCHARWPVPGAKGGLPSCRAILSGWTSLGLRSTAQSRTAQVHVRAL